MNKIPFSQMEGILTQKKDLRKNRCFITFLDATKVSNIKEFIDRSRSVAPFYPITRGLKGLQGYAGSRPCLALHRFTR